MDEMSREEWHVFVLEATRTGGRYMGADRAEEYGARRLVPGELRVRVAPTPVLARRGLAD